MKGGGNVDRVSIEEAIAEAGLKKKYVAAQLGISETYINTYLRNASEISVKNAAIICSLTGKDMNELDFGQEGQREE